MTYGRRRRSSFLGVLPVGETITGATSEFEITFDFYFVRLKDSVNMGSLTYTAQFSSDLVTFYDSTVPPVVVVASTDDPDYEVVKIPYPTTLPNLEKARFARVKVEQSP